MRTPSRAWPLAAAVVLAAACSGGGEATGEPDAGGPAADAGLACSEVPLGEAFQLRFGVTSDAGDFDELLDGEECPIRLGNQGILMLLGELRIALSDAPDPMCCTARVSASGDFAGRVDTAPVALDAVEGELGGATLTLLAGREMEETLDGAEVTVSWSCDDGAGGSGSVERSVRFVLLAQ